MIKNHYYKSLPSSTHHYPLFASNVPRLPTDTGAFWAGSSDWEAAAERHGSTEDPWKATGNR